MISTSRPNKETVAIIGTGPAGLMAAHVIISAGFPVKIFEKKRGPGRKLLIAGSSGLNVSYDHPREDFHRFYSGPTERFQEFFDRFSPQDWLNFIHQLGLETFKGTSRRYFVREMKASGLLRAWTQALKDLGAEIVFQQELTDFETLHATATSKSSGIRLRFNGDQEATYSAACLSLGGGSYTQGETPLRWPSILARKGISFSPFLPSNVGYQVDWPQELLKEAEGMPLKNISLTTSRGTRGGEMVITRYGLEGTPVYFTGTSGEAYLDLKPDLTIEQIRSRLGGGKENLSPIRRIKKYLNLAQATHALIFHLTPRDIMSDLNALIPYLKRFPIHLKNPQPLEEAISSRGGIDWKELTPSLMLKSHPGIFAAGEMLNWDAPTGGFLIQGCVSQGYVAGQEMVKYLSQSLN